MSTSHAAQAPGRRARRRAETREVIFRAALRLFAERGVAGTTVEDITEAADVGKGTFFNYFPTKEHVLAAFGEMQLGKARAVLSAPWAAGAPFPELMKQTLRALAEEPGRTPALVRSLVGAFLSSEDVRRIMRVNIGRGLRYITAALEQAQERGEIRRDVRPAEAARFVFHNWFGTLVLWTMFPGEPLAKRVEANFALVLAALVPPERRAR